MVVVSNVAHFVRSREAAAERSIDADNGWTIHLAGPMRISKPGSEGALPTVRKARALIAYLCLAPTKRAKRAHLAALLWDRSGDLARRSLRQAIHDVERANGMLSDGLLRLDEDEISLNVEACWIDVFEEPGGSVDPLLPDLDGVSEPFDRWLANERLSHEDRVRNYLYTEVTRLEAESAPADRRAAAARKLLSYDQAHEGAVRALMRALAELGEHVQALREYERCRAELRRTLEVSPSRATITLHEMIRLVSSRNAPVAAPPVKADAVVRKPGSPTPERPSAPSIAVLPFNNLSGVPQHDCTTAALAEDVISLLSRLPGFVVISRLSTRIFTKQDDRSPQDIGDLLDVRYLLSGSLRVAGERLHLNVELTDAIRGTVLSSQEVDEKISNVIDLPMQLAEEIVRQATPNLRRAELRRIRLKRPELLNAYDYFLQAQEDMYNLSQSVFSRAEQMFDRALVLEPNFAAALAGRAHWHLLRVGQGWSTDPALDTQDALDYAAKALDSDPFESLALGIQGHIAAYLQKDFDLAFERFEAASRLNPNVAPVWVWSGATRAWGGDGKRAIEEAKRGIALSPFDPFMYFFSAVLGMSYLADTQYERAVECGFRALRDNRNFTSGHRLLVLGLMLAGRPDEARSAARRLLALEPGLTVEKFRARYPGATHPHADLYCDAFTQAGVPRH
jgi:TolB-like protein